MTTGKFLSIVPSILMKGWAAVKIGKKKTIGRRLQVKPGVKRNADPFVKKL